MNRLNIARKQTGDRLTPAEFNAVVDAINAIDDRQILLEEAFEQLIIQLGLDRNGHWLTYRGSTTIGGLPVSSPEYEGMVYAVSGPFASRADFLTGSGVYYESGAWVACVMRENDDGSVDYLWDVMADLVSPGGDTIPVDSITVATVQDIQSLFSGMQGLAIEANEGWQLGMADTGLL